MAHKGLSMLQNETDWDDYRRSASLEYSVSSAQVEWGSGPKQFPCLIASYPVSPTKMVSCYIYLDDARRLLFCDASLAGPPADTDEDDAIELPPDQIGDEVAVRAASLLSQLLVEKKVNRDDYERHVSAMLLTVVNLLVDTGIVKEDIFEQRLSNYQRLVDEWVTEARDDIGDVDKKILNRLYP